MKFGRRVQEEAYEPFKDHYICYKALKKAIKLITGNDSSNGTISEVTDAFGSVVALEGFTRQTKEAQFQNLLNFEVEKINAFAVSTFLSLRTTLKHIIIRCRNAEQAHDADEFKELRHKAENVAEQVVKLHAYVRLNFLGFRKITKKYDKHNETAASCWYLSRIIKEKFMVLDFDFLVNCVAFCFIQLNLPSHDGIFANTSSNTQPFTEEQLDAMTHETYLVDEDHLMYVRIELAKHFPLISIGGDAKDTLKMQTLMSTWDYNAPHLKRMHSHPCLQATDTQSRTNANKRALGSRMATTTEGLHREAEVNISNSHKSRTSTSCVYFDNPESFSTYKTVIGSSPESRHSCLRLRWSASPGSSEILSTKDSSHSLCDTKKWFLTPVYMMLEIVSAFPIPASPGESWHSFSTRNSNSQLRVPSHIAEVILTQNKIETKTISELLEYYSNSKDSQQVADNIIEMIRENNLTPVMQQWFHRTQFRHSHLCSGGVLYATLDENIRFSSMRTERCTTQPETMGSLWNPPPFHYIALDHQAGLRRFGVLSVSYSEVKRPAILTRIAGLSSVTQLWNYSAFLHGIGSCFPDDVALSLQPEWLNFVRSPIYLDHGIKSDLRDAHPKLLPQKSTKKESYNDSGIRVDVISTNPRERVVYEHALDVQQKVLPLMKDCSQGTQEYVSQNARKEWKPSNTLASRNLTTPLLNIDHATLECGPHELLTPTTKKEFMFKKYITTLGRCIQKTFHYFWGIPRAHHATKVVVRIEPKTFFANERTLLQWLNTAVLLSTISVTLLNFGSSSGTRAGFILAPVALFFIIYSFFVYLKRCSSLEKKEPIDYNDRFGPCVLVVSLIGALSSIVVLNIVTPTVNEKTVP